MPSLRSSLFRNIRMREHCGRFSLPKIKDCANGIFTSRSISQVENDNDNGAVTLEISKRRCSVNLSLIAGSDSIQEHVSNRFEPQTAHENPEKLLISFAAPPRAEVRHGSTSTARSIRIDQPAQSGRNAAAPAGWTLGCAGNRGAAGSHEACGQNRQGAPREIATGWSGRSARRGHRLPWPVATFVILTTCSLFWRGIIWAAGL